MLVELSVVVAIPSDQSMKILLVAPVFSKHNDVGPNEDVPPTVNVAFVSVAVPDFPQTLGPAASTVFASKIRIRTNTLIMRSSQHLRLHNLRHVSLESYRLLLGLHCSDLDPLTCHRRLLSL